MRRGRTHKSALIKLMQHQTILNGNREQISAYQNYKTQ
jgi:hypothetical protein